MKNKSNNTTLIERVRVYIYKKFSITEEELHNSSRKYIKELLQSIKSSNLQVKYLRIKRERLKEDIKDLEASFVVGDSYDREFTGPNTGLQANTTEIKYMKRATMKEELQTLVLKTLEIEKSLEDNNNLISDFIGLISKEEYQIILKMTYIDCMSNIEISKALFYAVNTIDNARWRGIRELTKLIKN